jgi:hypothetical protein
MCHGEWGRRLFEVGQTRGDSGHNSVSRREEEALRYWDYYCYYDNLKVMQVQIGFRRSTAACCRCLLVVGGIVSPPKKIQVKAMETRIPCRREPPCLLGGGLA